MRYDRFPFGGSALFFLVLSSLTHLGSSARLNAAFKVTDIEPVSGPIGTRVTLTGEDFSAHTGIGVTVNGTAATEISAAATMIGFIVATGTTPKRVTFSLS